MTRRQRRGIRQTIMQKFLHTNYWFINSLVTMVTDGATTEGAFAIYQQVGPPGFATPYHTHEAYGRRLLSSLWRRDFMET